MNVSTLWRAHRGKIIILMLLLGGGGYYAYSKTSSGNSGVQYITAQPIKGTMVVSVSGTGQVSASSQVDVKPTVSGNIVSLNVTNGQQVKTGQLIAQLDASDAQKAVRDAETNLETARLSLDKLQQPADELSLTKAQNSLLQAQESLTNTQDDLAKTYTDASTTIAGAFLQLPGIMTGMQQMFYNSTYEQNQWNIDWYANRILTWDSSVLNYKRDLTSAYDSAKVAYDAAFSAFQAMPSNASSDVVETVLQQTYDTTRLISEAVKQATTYLDFIDNVTADHNSSSPQTMKSDQSTLRTYTSTVNGQLPQLLSAITDISNAKTAIVTSNRTVRETTLSLESLQAGPDALDVRSQQLTIEQRQNALADAKSQLADYSVRAPFDGTVTNLDQSLRRGSSVSTGTAIASIITVQRVAEISLNEIDVAKIKAGQPVNLTFDALDGVTMTGKVADIDVIGTVSQGVVSYNVKIAFDLEDERIKPGMSVSANIITESKADVLMVPNSAVKTQNGATYVEVLENGAPQRKTVEAGLSNDTMTEVMSGLTESDQVVTQTITASSGTNSSSGTSGNSNRNNFGAVRVLEGGTSGPPR